MKKNKKSKSRAGFLKLTANYPLFGKDNSPYLTPAIMESYQSDPGVKDNIDIDLIDKSFHNKKEM
ncbi:MAG: hypothetical protein ACFFFB_15465 [Candidatus Heimdallarchaeota archaeon]